MTTGQPQDARQAAAEQIGRDAVKFISSSPYLLLPFFRGDHDPHNPRALYVSLTVYPQSQW